MLVLLNLCSFAQYNIQREEMVSRLSHPICMKLDVGMLVDLTQNLINFNEVVNAKILVLCGMEGEDICS